VRYCTGKKPKKSDYRTLLFKNYVTTALSPPPPASANLARVYKALGISDPTALFPMDGNDTAGCCTIAGAAHFTTIFNAFLGKKSIPITADILALYTKLTGGPDTGLVMLDVLNYLRQNAFLGESPVLAFVSVDPHNTAHMQQAINWFGGLYTGFQVPEACQQQFEDGQIWTPGPLTNDGHCVVLVDYTPDTLIPLTWGNTATANYAWEAECCDELYAIIPAEAAQSGYAPGFDLAALQADLADVTA
jgi:hypothetical protein